MKLQPKPKLLIQHLPWFWAAPAYTEPLARCTSKSHKAFPTYVQQTGTGFSSAFRSEIGRGMWKSCGGLEGGARPVLPALNTPPKRAGGNNSNAFFELRVHEATLEEMRAQWHILLNVSLLGGHTSATVLFPSFPFLAPALSFLCNNYHYWRNYANMHFPERAVNFDRACLGIISSICNTTKQVSKRKQPTRYSQVCCKQCGVRWCPREG